MVAGNIQFSNKRVFESRLLKIKRLVTSIFFFYLFQILSTGCSNPDEIKLDKKPSPVLVNNADYNFPKKITEAIQQKYSNSILIKKSDYAPLFWDFYDANTVPSMATTDINNDQKSDFAFLIQTDHVIQIVIALSDNEKYHYWQSPFSLGQFEKKGVEIALDVKPAGQTDIVKPKAQSLVLKKNGFLIRKLEQDYLILYEQKGEIISFKLNGETDF